MLCWIVSTPSIISLMNCENSFNFTQFQWVISEWYGAKSDRRAPNVGNKPPPGQERKDVIFGTASEPLQKKKSDCPIPNQQSGEECGVSVWCQNEVTKQQKKCTEQSADAEEVEEAELTASGLDGGELEIGHENQVHNTYTKIKTVRRRKHCVVNFLYFSPSVLWCDSLTHCVYGKQFIIEQNKAASESSVHKSIVCTNIDNCRGVNFCTVYEQKKVITLECDHRNMHRAIRCNIVHTGNFTHRGVVVMSRLKHRQGCLQCFV